MGIHGLTTYLGEQYAAVSQRLQFPSSSTEPAVFVIDGWSFIYEVLSSSGLPWVYGGEYAQVAKLVEATVRAWLSVELRLHFVFDGPYPPVKFPTITSRITQTAIQGSLLFFRTSAPSRSKPRFLHEVAMLPPLAYMTCIQSLRSIIQSLGTTERPSASQGGLLELHFADEEGDPFSVELAARLGGYVVGNDSDFVILNAEGYKGYVPMNEMSWSSLSTDDESASHIESDGEFQTVVNSKSRKKAALRQRAGQSDGIIPPDGVDDLQLSVSVYSPAKLAAHLQIPVSLLPLLGALVGNDFTGSKESSITTSQQTNLQWLFFERHLNNSQRINRVAFTLRSILDAALTPSPKGKQKLQVNSVMQLIERAITALMVRSSDTLASGERERIVERIVEATLQYAIPKFEGDSGESSLWASPLCALHDDETCSLVRYLSRLPSTDIPESEEELEQRDTLRDLYVAAYRTGDLDPRLLDIMNTGTFWYRQFLENPDHESVGRSIARPLHEVIYALLDSTFTLPGSEDKSPSDEGSDDDDDELVDVTEESDDEDPLAPLRGALQQLDASVDHVMTDQPASVSSSSAPSRPRRKLVIEYIRRGARFASEEVVVPSLVEVCRHYGVQLLDIPLQLRSEDDRLTFFLQALRSDTTSVRSLPPNQMLIALSLRWTASTMDTRALESNGSKERVKERWTKQEARAFLASFPDAQQTDDFDDADAPPVVDRNVQLVAQALSAYGAVVRFAQVLLLHNHITTSAVQFSGKLFHSFLTGKRPIPADAVASALWDACVQDIPGVFAESDKQKRKRELANGRVNGGSSGHVASVGKGRNSAAKGGSMFHLLGSMNA